MRRGRDVLFVMIIIVIVVNIIIVVVIIISIASHTLLTAVAKDMKDMALCDLTVSEVKVSSTIHSFIHSFIHIAYLYSASEENYSEALPTPVGLRLNKAVLKSEKKHYSLL